MTWMLCPVCKRRVPVDDDECECGFDFIDGRPD